MSSPWRLLRYARPYWRSLGIVTVTMLLNIGLEVIRPWPMKLLVDNVLGEKPMMPLLQNLLAWLPGPESASWLLFWVALSTVAIFLVSTLLSMANSLASVSLGQRMTYALGADLFLHLQRMSLLFHSRRPVGDSLARVTGDPSCVQVLTTGVLFPLLQASITLVVMFGVMWKLHPLLTIISLAVVPLLMLTIRLFGGEMKSQTLKRREIEGRMMNIVQHTLSAMPAVQAFTREKIEHDRFRRQADEALVAYHESTLSQLKFKLYVGIVTAVGTAAVMLIGGRLVMSGQITIGSILVFLSYLAALYAPLNAITYSASTIQGAAANAQRVTELLALRPDVEDTHAAQDVAIKGNVRYENVSFSYEAGRAALQDVSFDVEAGEVIAIVGPTGAGKTTLVNLMLRFFDPSSGRVTIDGVDLKDIRIHSLRDQIAMVLQEPFIFPYSVAENINYGRPGASREQIIAAAEAANADDFIQRMPEGYDTIVGERGASLSGGERQRLSIARAFLKDAPILILDEPTSALDARTEGRLLEAIERLMKDRTTFIIAHRLSTIRRADRILVVDRGRVVEEGNHDELLRTGGLYSQLYHRQTDTALHELTQEG